MAIAASSALYNVCHESNRSYCGQDWGHSAIAVNAGIAFAGMDTELYVRMYAFYACIHVFCMCVNLLQCVHIYIYI